MTRKAMLLVLLIAGALALAGCTGSSSGDGGGGEETQTRTQYTQQQMEDRAEAAIVAFGEDLDSADGGDIKSITLDMDGNPGEPDVSLTAEWGSNDVFHLEVSAGQGGIQISLGMYCSPTRSVMEWGDEVLESREDLGEGCEEVREDQFGDDFIDPSDVDDSDLQSVTQQSDGSIRATYTDENGTYTLTIDPQGRLVQLQGILEEGVFTVTIEYGTRSVITMPATTARIPASIFAASSWEIGGTFQWEVFSSDPDLPLEEFEVRVLDNETGEVLATFPFDSDGEQVNGGFVFTFFDNNATGDLDAPDNFTLIGEGWSEPDQYDIIIWDKWADRSIDDVPLPGPAFLMVALALVAAALLARRRTR